MNHVLLTGANGQLGQAIQAELARRGVQCTATSRDTLDIYNVMACHDVLKSVKPDAIINCAAYTNVDGAESNRAQCYNTNTLGTFNLGCLSLVHDIPLLHISTDYVFAGDKNSPYTTTDATRPISVYGTSKLDGEIFLRNVVKKYVVRLSSVFGPAKINFVSKVILRAQSRETMEVVEDQTALITYTVDVAPLLLDILESGAYGLYHLGNCGAVSRYEWARFIVQEAGLKCKVVPVPSSKFNLPAKRPCYSVLDTSCTTELLSCSVPDWQDATRRFVATLRGAGSLGQLEGVH